MTDKTMIEQLNEDQSLTEGVKILEKELAYRGIQVKPGEILSFRNRFIKNNGQTPIYVNDDNWRELGEEY